MLKNTHHKQTTSGHLSKQTAGCNHANPKNYSVSTTRIRESRSANEDCWQSIHRNRLTKSKRKYKPFTWGQTTMWETVCETNDNAKMTKFLGEMNRSVMVAGCKVLPNHESGWWSNLFSRILFQANLIETNVSNAITAKRRVQSKHCYFKLALIWEVTTVNYIPGQSDHLIIAITPAIYIN